MSTAGRAGEQTQACLRDGDHAKTDWATVNSEMKQSGIERTGEQEAVQNKYQDIRE